MQILSFFITVALSAVGTFVIASVRDLRTPAGFRASLFGFGAHRARGLQTEPTFEWRATPPAIDASIAIAKARAGSVSQHLSIA
jgi:hypothetical protein